MIIWVVLTVIGMVVTMSAVVEIVLAALSVAVVVVAPRVLRMIIWGVLAVGIVAMMSAVEDLASEASTAAVVVAPGRLKVMIWGVLAVGIVAMMSAVEDSVLDASTAVVVVVVGDKVAFAICVFEAAPVLLSGSYVNTGPPPVDSPCDVRDLWCAISVLESFAEDI